MAFDDRKYVVIPTTAITQVNFSEVLETHAETCRYSADGTQTFVKYDGAQPASVAAISNKSAELTHAQMLELLSTSEWQEPLSEF